jgi:hypothetical protein
MKRFRSRFLVAISAILVCSSLAVAAVPGQGGGGKYMSRGKRLESPGMRRQSVGNSHMLQLYETWMVELFCSKARNRERLAGEAKACTSHVIQSLLITCSAQIREQGPRAYFKAAPEGAEFLRIVQSYQDCLRRGADRASSGRRAARSIAEAGS